MMNPICTAGFACAAWIFFRDRIGSQLLTLTPQPTTSLSLPFVTNYSQNNRYIIAYEETTLIAFFGKEYESYRARVPVGIPYLP